MRGTCHRMSSDPLVFFFYQVTTIIYISIQGEDAPSLLLLGHPTYLVNEQKMSMVCVT